MLESFTATIDVTVPFMLLALLGLFMRRKGFFSTNFIKQGNKLLFYFGIPTTIFNHIHSADLSEILDFNFLLFNSLWLIGFFLVTWFLAYRFMSDKESVSGFVNSAYRSSLSVVGPPLFILMFYDPMLDNNPVLAKSLMSVSVLLIISYATASVLFAVHNSKAKQISGIGIFKDTLLSIVKNPIVIGVVVGILFNVLGWQQLPTFADRTVSALGGIVMPLAMICVGGNLRFHGFDKKFKYVVISSVVKLFVMPIASVAAAILFGFSGSDLTIIMILNALPMAVGAYVMQAELGGGDLYIGASTLMITMVLSAFTLTAFIFAFRMLGILV